MQFFFKRKSLSFQQKWWITKRFKNETVVPEESHLGRYFKEESYFKMLHTHTHTHTHAIMIVEMDI